MDELESGTLSRLKEVSGDETNGDCAEITTLKDLNYSFRGKLVSDDRG